MATNNSWNSQNPAEVAKGGTGRDSLTAHSVLSGNAASPVNLIAPSATVDVPLVSKGFSTPAFDTMLVAGGGTGNTTTTTPFGVICGGTTPTGNLQNAGVGTAGQVLKSNGPAALPTWGTGSSLGLGDYIFYAYMRREISQLTGRTGDGTDYHVRFDRVRINTGSVWNTTTSTYTAPIDGLYAFHYMLMAVSIAPPITITENVRHIVSLQGPDNYVVYDQLYNFYINVETSFVCDITIQLSAGQTIMPFYKATGYATKTFFPTSEGNSVVYPTSALSGYLIKAL